jgi:hypothetical protein
MVRSNMEALMWGLVAIAWSTVLYGAGFRQGEKCVREEFRASEVAK